MRGASAMRSSVDDCPPSHKESARALNSFRHELSVNVNMNVAGIATTDALEVWCVDVPLMLDEVSLRQSATCKLLLA